MKPDLDTLRAFFASAPFMVDLGIEPFERDAGAIANRASRSPAGPCFPSAKNEPHGVVLSPFALVTFIWGRK